MTLPFHGDHSPGKVIVKTTYTTLIMLDSTVRMYHSTFQRARIKSGEASDVSLLIAPSLHFGYSFLGRTDDVLPILDPVGMFIVAGDNYLGLQG